VYPAVSSAPLQRAGIPVWYARRGDVEVRFTGRVAAATRAEALSLAAGGAAIPEVAWTKQVHSATVLMAAPGVCGEGDALVTPAPALALAIATADCVPVLLAGEGEVAAAHAGWRGIAAKVLAATLAAMRTPAERVHTWVGPSIGPCCYEVGEEVAEAASAASSESVVLRQGLEKPHLDLHAAARTQLLAGGVRSIEALPICTRCAADLLWSYRREGSGAGRNLAFIWRIG
jgi:YfiH family protein